MGDERQAPRHARPFVAILLSAIVVSAIFTIEAWPLTGWQLFSHARTEERSSWQAVAVNRDGEEREYPLGALPRGYRGFPFLMVEFTDASEPRRAELCRAWVGGTGELLDRPAPTVRIYELRWTLSDRRGDRAEPPSRTLRFVCTGRGAREA